MIERTLIVFMTLLTALAVPRAASAADDYIGAGEEVSPVDVSGAVVRRKLLYRSTRFELAPLFGATIADPLGRNLMAGLNLNFHLTNEFAIGVNGFFGFTTLRTSLGEEIEEQAGEPNSGRADALGASAINYIANLEGSYVPIFGKLSFLDAASISYDFHINAGVGLVSLKTDAIGPGASDQLIEETTIAPMVGVGTRFYFGDFVSLNLDLRDYLYSASVAASTLGERETELSNNLVLSLGLGFFFPTSVKVSR